MPSGIKPPYETDYSTLLNWHNSTDKNMPTALQPYKRYGYNPIAAGVSKVGGVLGNVPSVMMQPDQRTASEKGTDMANYLQNRIGPDIGVSQGATSVGVPTSSGIAPMVSFNFGKRASKSDVVPQSFIERLEKHRNKVLPPTPTTTTNIPEVAPAPGTTKNTAIPTTANPVAPALPKFVGYGGYSDGSNIGDTMSAADKMLLPGSNAGLPMNMRPEGGGGNNALGLIYSPEEQKQVQDMISARDNQPTALPVRDMSPGSQGAWEADRTRQVARDSMLSALPEVSRGLSKNVFKAEEALTAQDNTKQAALNSNRNFELGNRNFELGLGTQDIRQGELDLKGEIQPTQIKALEASISDLQNKGQYREAQAKIALLKQVMGGVNGAKGSETDYFDSGRGSNYIDTLKMLREDLGTLTKGTPEYTAKAQQIENYYKANAAHGNKPSKPATALGTRYNASDALPEID